MPYPCFLWFYTSSTLCSSLLIISSGGAVSMCSPLNLNSLHHVGRSLLNILYIAHPSSKFSWNASWLISFIISKGLYLFWSSFFKGHFDWIFLISNHTLSLSFNLWGFYLHSMFWPHLFLSMNNLQFSSAHQTLSSADQNQLCYLRYFC